MSAEERRHAGAPKKIDEPVISEERLRLMQMPESEENVALAQQREWEIDRRPEITSGAALETDETRDRLLCAISETDVAKRLMPAVDRQHHPPAFAEPPKTAFRTVGAEVQPSAEVVQTAPPAAGPTRTFIVQTSPVGASMPLMPLAATEPRHLVPPEPDNSIEKEKTRYKLLRAINEASHLGGEIPASNPQFRHFFVQTSPQAASAPLMPPPTQSPRPRVSATPRMIESATWAAIPHVPSRPQPVAVAELAPAATTPLPVTPAQDLAPGSTILVWCSSGVNRLSAKLAQTTKRMGRALWQISARLQNRVAAGATLILESTGIAGSRRSTGLGNSAHAAQSAPETESMGRARSQPTGLQKWFDPRRSPRFAKPPAVAWCWTADTPGAVKIADISSGGVHLLTDVRWPRGGVLSMTLQRTDRTSETPESWVVINFIVIRLCSDGIAGAFIPSTHRLSGFIHAPAENCADDRTLKSFVRHLAVHNSA